LKTKVSFTLNNNWVSVLSSPNETLLHILRNKFGITSVKNGCNTGDCGTCTVIINGTAVRSCLILAPTIEGKTVETIEAIGGIGCLHPIQKAFHEFGAAQCGYCTPAMILTAKAFIDNNPNPTHNQIVHAISGNLCRCTGYKKIIEAIETAALRLNKGSENVRR
jgi:carbon-monoxide dehydrogenase small subunit